jgi:hypothetical protein
MKQKNRLIKESVDFILRKLKSSSQDTLLLPEQIKVLHQKASRKTVARDNASPKKKLQKCNELLCKHVRLNKRREYVSMLSRTKMLQYLCYDHASIFASTCRRIRKSINDQMKNRLLSSCYQGDS